MHSHSPSGGLSFGSSQALQCSEIVSPQVVGTTGLQQLNTPRSQPLIPKDLSLDCAVQEAPTGIVPQRSRSSERGTIHSLPPEVLSLIFAASISPLEGQDHNEPIDTTLRSVCRLWRDVIDGTPQLWTYVLLRQKRFNPKQLRTLVDRSKTCPLELRVHIQCLAAFNELLDVLQSVMPRTRYLYLSCEPCNMHLDLTTRHDWPALYSKAQGVMRTLMETPTPLLEVLDLRMIQVPGDIFAGMTPPKLRSVHLLDCNPVPPRSSFFNSSLTSLVIDFCRSWENVDDMLGALSNLPHLKRFQWDTDSYQEDHPPFVLPTAYKPKSLPMHELEHLEVSSSFDNVISIIDILDFRPSTVLVVSGELLEEPTINTPAFDDLLNKISQDLEPHLRRSFTSESSGFGRLVIHPYRGTNDDGIGAIFELPRGDGQLPSRLEFGVFWDMDKRSEYLAILQRMFSWPGMRDTVTRLEVDHRYFMFTESRSWCTILRALPNLTKVTAGDGGAMHFLHALRTLASSVDPTERDVVSKLRVIALIDFDEDGVLPELFALLHERKALCLSSLEINLENCNIDEPTLARLRAHAKVESVRVVGNSKPTIVEDDHDEFDHEEYIHAHPTIYL